MLINGLGPCNAKESRTLPFSREDAYKAFVFRRRFTLIHFSGDALRSYTFLVPYSFLSFVCVLGRHRRGEKCHYKAVHTNLLAVILAAGPGIVCFKVLGGF